MKICVVHVNAEKYSGSYTPLISANFEKAKAEGTTISHRFVQHLKRATDTVFAYPSLLNKIDVAEEMLKAEAEGADAVMVACSGDTGVAEARTLVSIPVVGPMEAALHLACAYGHKVGIVTTADRSWSEYCEMMVSAYGLSSRFAGVRRIATPSSEAFTKGFTQPQEMAREIAANAKALVEAGANSIVIGSAGMSVMATAAGLSRVPEYGAPIFDCLTVGLKTAELRSDLQRKLAIPETSRVGWGERLMPPDLGRLRKLFALAPQA
jgi:allantoin racemase